MNSFKYKGLTYRYYNPSEIDILDGYIERYSRTKYANVGGAFDIETTKVDDNHSIMYVWQFAVGRFVFIGRTWQEFDEFMERLPDYIPEDITLLCYVHNLSFEWSFIKHRLDWNYNDKYKSYDVFSKDSRNIIYATYKNIQFRDSLILTQMPLKDIPKNFHTPTQKLNDAEEKDLDYNKIRTVDTVLTNGELAYCINDVVILSELYQKYICADFLRNNIKPPLTCTGVVRSEMKRELKASEDYKDYKRMISKDFPSEALYKSMIKWVFRGGMVHSTAESSNRTITSVMYSYDRKSSYIASFLHNNYPYRFVKRVPTWFYQYKDDKKVLKKYCYMGTFIFRNIRTTKGISIESESKLIESDGCIFDNGRLVRANYIKVCLTDVDFDLYKMFMEWDCFECVSLMVADKKPLPEFMRKALCKYFYNKEVTPKNDDNYARNKSKLNSIYGLTVQKLLNDNLQYNPATGLFDFGDNETYDKIKRKQFLLPQWGLWCTAYSRYSLLVSIAKTYDEIKAHQNSLYQDTDSNKIDNPLIYSYIYEDYNAREKRINRTMETFGYPKEIFEKIGCFEFEEKIYKGKFLGAKRYLISYVTYNKDTKKYEFKPHITVSGCKKGSVERYCKENAINIYDFFSDNMELTAEDSGKLRPVYTDEEFTLEVQDYQGHITTHTELSCVTLVSAPFSLSMSEDYINYIEFLNQKYHSEGFRI